MSLLYHVNYWRVQRLFVACLHTNCYVFKSEVNVIKHRCMRDSYSSCFMCVCICVCVSACLCVCLLR